MFHCIITCPLQQTFLQSGDSREELAQASAEEKVKQLKRVLNFTFENVPVGMPTGTLDRRK
jgi:hypothetical protein